MRKHRWMALALTLLLMIAAIIPTMAADPLGSVTILLKSSGKPLEGNELVIYRVAEKDGSMAGDFVLSGLTEAKTKAQASALADFAKINGLDAFATGKTNGEGKVTFSDLPEGTYLICQGTKDPAYYPITPFFAPTPLDGKQYTYYARPKVRPDVRPELKSVSVQKVWKGGADYPDSVTVQLWHDGKLYDSAVLNEGNGWSHTWTGLSKSKDWEVREDPVPTGFISTVEQSGDRFTVTNEKNPNPTPAPSGTPNPEATVTPEPGTDPNPEESGEIKTTPEPAASTTPDGGDGDTLIQTGQLKWPIPVLALSGILLFALGWSLTFLKGRKK